MFLISIIGLFAAEAPILLLLYFCTKTETHPGWRRAMANTSPCEEQRKFRPFIFAVFLPLLSCLLPNTFRFENAKPSYLPAAACVAKGFKDAQTTGIRDTTFTVVFRFSFSSRSSSFCSIFPSSSSKSSASSVSRRRRPTHRDVGDEISILQRGLPQRVSTDDEFFVVRARKRGHGEDVRRFCFIIIFESPGGRIFRKLPKKKIGSRASVVGPLLLFNPEEPLRLGVDFLVFIFFVSLTSLKTRNPSFSISYSVQ